jgi:hypothetical protein
VNDALFTDQEKLTKAWVAEHGLVGLPEDEACAAASTAGILLRVVSDDSKGDASENDALTADLRPNRVNVELVGGRVARVAFIG